MTLVHTALLSEAQAIIEKYKLQKVNSSPKIYANKKIVVLIGGIGAQNTLDSLEYLFKNYTVSKAINIGIAGCGDTSKNIGGLFCTNHTLENIEYILLKTVHTAQTQSENITSLYDMEGQYFLEVTSEHLKDDEIYIFKVISDYLDDTILKKDDVKKLIQNSMTKWCKYI